MSKLKQLLILSFCAVTLFSACSKNENPQEDEPDTDPHTSIIISGGKFKPNSNGWNDSIPTYWVDGIEKQLSNSKINRQWANSSAIAISKAGKIHFIASGWVDNGIVSQYWIDGTEQTLPLSLGGFVRYTAATVQDEKFHVIGTQINDDKYWIDGVAQSFPNVEAFSDISLSADGNSVGIAGRSTSGSAVSIVKGVTAEIPGRISADKIAINQGGVYIVGIQFEDTAPYSLKYWVAGVKHDLPHSSHDFARSALVVSNGKVHIIAELYGSSTTYKYWIDGIEQSLPTGVTGLKDITAFEGKIYILGSASGQPAYWIDGVAHDFPAAMDYANKIIVVRK
ncbi:hypothetical protein [Pedobacter heparinus]|uniref:hypothetical protein n=1 Tax=Pedobacter heparinus TaxID=984 RepID=UPI00293059E0|nr:hypothetical protein [Pedobacter heparinus]